MTVSNASQNVVENLVTIDRRRSDRRNANEEVANPVGVRAPRPKKQRRRHIDPTTCERDYSEDELEFMRAMDDYKRDSGRMFPTCSEVLEVIRALGYYKLDDEQAGELGLYAIDLPCGEGNTDDEDADMEEVLADE